MHILESIKVTKKERYILHLIDRHDYITSAVLHGLSQHRTQRYRWMRSLEEKGLIERFSYAIDSSLWFLTPLGKAFQKLQNPNFFSTFKIERDKKTITPVHNSYTALFDIKINTLQEQTNADHKLVTDKYLKKHFRENERNIKLQTGGLIRIPDGEFYYKDHLMAFEIELSKKSRDRYRNIFRFFRDYYDYKRVYWLFLDEALKDYLISLFIDFHNADLPNILNSSEAEFKIERNKKLHVFCNINDFLESGFDAKLTKINSER